MRMLEFYGRDFLQKQDEKAAHSRSMEGFFVAVYGKKIKHKNQYIHLKGV
jgi:hypothetical protein